MDSWKGRMYEQVVGLKKMALATIQSNLDWDKVSIFFFPTEPTHINQMIPVAKAFLEVGINIGFFTPRISIWRVLRMQRLPYFLISGRNGNDGERQFLSLDQVAEVFRNFDGGEELKLIRSSYSDVLRLSRSLAGFLREARPAYIFVGNDLTWECRLLAQLCELRNIRTGMIQHGLLGHEIYNRLHVVDDFFVYGPAFQRILEMDGLKSTNVIVSGAPYLDSKSLIVTNEPNALLKRRFKIDGSYVLVAFSGAGDRTTHENYQAILSWVKRLMDDHPELDIVVKLHRKERLSAYSAFSPQQHSRIVDGRRGRGLPTDIFEWLKGCSCLITGTSTMVYEAMILNIPIISVDPLRQYKGINFIEEKAVDVVTTYQELERSLISKLGKTVDYQPFIGKIFAGTDGLSATRIVNEVRRVTGI